MFEFILGVAVLLAIGYIMGRFNWPYAAIGFLLALLGAYLLVWDNQYLWLPLALEYDVEVIRTTRTAVTVVGAGVAWAVITTGGKLGSRGEDAGAVEEQSAETQ